MSWLLISGWVGEVSQFGLPTKAQGYFGWTHTKASASLAAALWVFRYDGNNVKSGMELAVKLGGDTTSIAALYGMLAGACYGYDSLPGDWVSKLFRRDHIERLASFLVIRRHG